MTTPIEFGKEFLTAYYTKLDIEKALTYLAEDVTYVAPGEFLHLRDKEEQRRFFIQDTAERGEPYYVDVAEIVSDPTVEGVRTVSYNMALIPKDAARAVRVRATMVVRDVKRPGAEDTCEITTVHLSRLFRRSATEGFAEFLNGLPGAVMLVNGLGQQGVRVKNQNTYFADHLGYKVEDYIATAKKDAFFFLSEEDKKTLLPLMAEPAKEESRSEVPHPRMCRVSHADGSVRRMAFFLRCSYEEEGIPVSLVQFLDLEDETAAKEAQRDELLGTIADLEGELHIYKGLSAGLPMNIYKGDDLLYVSGEMPSLFEQPEEVCRIGLAADPFYGFSLSSVTKESMRRIAMEEGRSERTVVLAGKDGSEKTLQLVLCGDDPYLYVLYLDRTEEAADLASERAKSRELLEASQTNEEKLRDTLENTKKQHEAEMTQLREDLEKELQQQKDRSLEKLASAEADAARRIEELRRDYEEKLGHAAEKLQRKEEALREADETITGMTQELEVEKIRAAEAEQGKTSFLAGVRSELRLPAEVTLSLVEKLQQSSSGWELRTGPSEEANDSLSKIRIAAQAMLDMADSLFEMENVAAGKEVAKNAPFVLRDLVEDLREEIGRRCAAKEQTFLCNVQNNIPDVLMGDSEKLRRILLNVLDNAVNYTRKGGRIRLSVSMSTPSGGVCPIKFVVEDTGVGIDEELMPRLFKPFVRGTAGAVANHSGFGLGLAVADGLVKLLGGSIGATSTPGLGSVFTIRLGMRAAENSRRYRGIDTAQSAAAAPQGIAQANGNAHDAGAAAGKRMTLDGCRFLVAEDDPLSMNRIEKVLKSVDCETERAHGGAEAAIRFKEAMPGTYQAVIMDYSMPFVDGLESARRIRDIEKKRGSSERIPILLLTSGAFEEDMADSFGSIVDGSVPKPVRSAALLSILKEVIK